MRPATSARSIASLSRSRTSTPAVPARLLHSTPRLAAEAVAQESSPSSTSSSALDSSSSSSAPTPAWPRPLPEGKLEAFDLALDFLRKRQAELDAKKEAARAQPDAKDIYTSLVLRGADSLEGVVVHDPEVRWKWEQGLLDPESPSALYFEREKFELGGALDLHEDRINAGSIVPDVAMVDKLHVDFGFKYPIPPPLPPPQPDQYGWVKKVRPYYTRDPKDDNRILCGARLTVKETLSQPELEIRHLGYDERTGASTDDRYTLLMIDPDVPDPSVHSYTQKVHWMVPNINLTPSIRVFPSPDMPLMSKNKHVSFLPDSLIPYLPPHPHKGSYVHRYTFLLLRHRGDINFGDEQAAGFVPTPKRDDFNFRKWLESVNEPRKADAVEEEKAVEVVGLSYFRSFYDEVICPQIWKELICKPEVKFNIELNSNRLYLDRWGVNKADAVEKKRQFEIRRKMIERLGPGMADKQNALRRRELLSAGLSTAQVSQIQAEESSGTWVDQNFPSSSPIPAEGVESSSPSSPSPLSAQSDEVVVKSDEPTANGTPQRVTGFGDKRDGRKPKPPKVGIPPKDANAKLELLKGQRNWPQGPTWAPKGWRYPELHQGEEGAEKKE